MPLLNVAGATDRAQEMTRGGLPTLAAITTKWASLPGLSQYSIYFFAYTMITARDEAGRDGGMNSKSRARLGHGANA